MGLFVGLNRMLSWPNFQFLVTVFVSLVLVILKLSVNTNEKGCMINQTKWNKPDKVYVHTTESFSSVHTGMKFSVFSVYFDIQKRESTILFCLY